MKNQVLFGCSKEKLKLLADNSIDSIVTDPPYELGFMGKSWDNTGIAYDVELWKECLRVLKHGGHLLAFGGTRTYHRMAVAIEDAGFEVRDMIEWVYGSGFPKSLNIGKAVDKIEGNEGVTINQKTYPDMRNNNYGNSEGKTRISGGDYSAVNKEWEGWGTALKPSHEPICLARKPIEKRLSIAENCLKWGVGGINIDGSRVEGELEEGRERHGGGVKSEKITQLDPNKINTMPAGRFPANLILSYKENEYLCNDNLSKEQKDKLYKWLNENT
jgi:hypothetical protein